MKTINIPLDCDAEIKRGDTINEILFEFDATDNIDLLNATIRMQLYLGVNLVLDLETESGITIIDSKSFKFDKIEYQDNDLPAGELKGDLEITDANGDRLTYFNVIYNIEKDFTI